MGNITWKAVETERDLQQFLRLPSELFADDPFWVPPLLSEERAQVASDGMFRTRADGALWLAECRGKRVGRIAAFLDHLAADRGVGTLGFFDAWNDAETAGALFSAAETWLLQRGARRVRGPLSPSLSGRVGVFVEGERRCPTIGMSYNPDYYMGLFESAGYTAGRDFLSYLVTRPNEAMFSGASSYPQFRFRHPSRQTMQRDLRLLRDLHNEAWGESGHYAFNPITRQEAEHMASALKFVADRQLILLVEAAGQLVGAILAIPDANPAIRRLNGRLGPIRLLKFLTTLRTIRRMRIMDVLVASTHQRIGLATAMLGEVMQCAERRGYTEFEYSWVVDDNVSSRRLAEKFGGRIVSRYRVYEKSLAVSG